MEAPTMSNSDSRETNLELEEVFEALNSLERKQEHIAAWRPEFMARAATDLQQGSEVLELAEAGDLEARTAVLKALEHSAGFVEREGSLSIRAEEALLTATSSASWLL